jgi:WD40 repeat protein
MESKTHYDKAISISFNQDYSLFSMGTENGFKIFNTYPFNQGYEKNLSGGIAKCELSYRSNYLALIGGGSCPKFSNKKVILYNDEKDSIESEFKFTTPVLNVKLKKFLIFIVCEKKIFVFNIENSQNIDCLETSTNKNGIIAINGDPQKTIMACPIEFNENDLDKGYISIKNYKNNKCFPFLAQDDKISYMVMDYYGLLLATANEKGTLIRIHSCKDGTLLQECKRGKEKAQISYINFDIDYNYMGVSSDRKTIHIWKLDNIIEKKEKNTISPSSNIKNDNVEKVYKKCKTIIDSNIDQKEDEIKVKDIKYYKTESSFSKVRMNDTDCIFCFVPNNIMIIISLKGIYYKAKIDVKGGDCPIILEKNIKEIREQQEINKKKEK